VARVLKTSSGKEVIMLDDYYWDGRIFSQEIDQAMGYEAAAWFDKYVEGMTIDLDDCRCNTLEAALSDAELDADLAEQALEEDRRFYKDMMERLQALVEVAQIEYGKNEHFTEMLNLIGFTLGKSYLPMNHNLWKRMVDKYADVWYNKKEE